VKVFVIGLLKATYYLLTYLLTYLNIFQVIQRQSKPGDARYTHNGDNISQCMKYEIRTFSIMSVVCTLYSKTYAEFNVYQLYTFTRYLPRLFSYCSD